MGGGNRPEGGPRRAIERIVAEALARSQPICLDSGPLIDYIAEKEPVASLLDHVLHHPDLPVIISTVTLSEVAVRPAMTGDAAVVLAIVARLRALPRFTIVDFDQRHAVEAAFVRAATGLKLPDAAIVASARLVRASALIGNDRQWRHKPLGVPYHHMDDLLARPS